MGAVGTTLKLFDSLSQPLTNVLQDLDKVLRIMEDIKITTDNIDLSKAIRETRTDIEIFTEQIGEVGKKLDQTSKKSNSFFNTFKKYLNMDKIIKGGKIAFNADMEYDDISRQVMAITGDSSQEMLQQLDRYTTVFATGGITKKDIAEGYQATSMEGWNFNESTFAMPILRDIKRGTGEEFEVISSLITGSMVSLGLSLDKLPQLADQMVTTKNISNMGMKELLEVYQGGAFKDVQTGKMSMAELNAIIGMFGSANINGSDAGTQIRDIMNGLYDTSQKPNQILSKMNIETYDNGETRNAFDIFEELGQKLSQYDDESKKKITSEMFNDYGEVDLNEIMMQFNKLPEYKAQIEESDGALEKMIETIDGGIGGRVRDFLSEFNTWLVAVGTALEPVVMLLIALAQSDIGSTLFILIQTVGMSIGFLAAMLMMLLAIIDPLAPIIWGLIGAMAVYSIQQQYVAFMEKMKTLATREGIIATMAKLVAEKGLIKATFMSIPVLIKEALAKLANLSPGLLLIAVATAVAVALVALAQKFDWLRVGMIKAINYMIKGVNWLLEQASKIPGVGKLMGGFRIKELDEETGLKFRNPFKKLIPNPDDMFSEFTETPELLDIPDFPTKMDIGNVDKVSRVDKNREVDISDEDIKLLRDVAMKEALIQYNDFKLEPSISFGDVYETADVGDIQKTIEDMLDEQIAISTELSYG